jgi:hypothetical protein
MNDLHSCRKSGGNPICDVYVFFSTSNRARLVPLCTSDPSPVKALLLEVLRGVLLKATDAMVLQTLAGAAADAEFRLCISGAARVSERPPTDCTVGYQLKNTECMVFTAGMQVKSAQAAAEPSGNVAETG